MPDKRLNLPSTTSTFNLRLAIPLRVIEIAYLSMAEKDYTSSLPPEIWHIILSYLIPTPEFLDPDYMLDRFPPWVINNRGWSDPTTYVQAESARTVLRRVCKSWDEVFRRDAHDYVRMMDVVHGTIPARCLRSAVRISFDHHAPLFCTACKPEKFRRDEVHDQSGGEYFELCRHILEHERPLQAKIVDYGTCSQEFLGNVLSPSTFPRVVHIHAKDQIMPTAKMIQFIESSPTLHHMYTRLEWIESRILPLKSSTLTTLMLSFRIPNPSFTIFTAENLDLPSLRHLSLGYAQYEEPDMYEEPACLPLLKVIGKELRTLSLSWDFKFQGEIDVPREIWSLCPKLEDMFITGAPFLLPPPPVGHPFHTLGMVYHWLTHRDDLEYSVPDWPGLRVIRISMSFDYWIGYGYGPLSSSQMEWLEQQRHVVLEDCRGDSYAEYLSRVG